MAKFRIEIFRVEYYKCGVIVEAENEDEAQKKVQEKWAEDDYLYEKTIDNIFDSETQFNKCGTPTEVDLKYDVKL